MSTLPKQRNTLKAPIYRLPDGWAGKKLQVVVIGAGGTGSAFLASLAQIAIALPQLGHAGLRVHVLDSDVVSPTNVGRQLFSPSDIGRSKAAVLVNRINMTYGLNWTAEVDRLGPKGAFNAEVLVGCVDNRAARRHMLEERLRVSRDETWWLDCGNGASSGQVVLGAWQRQTVVLPSVADLFPDAVDVSADHTDEMPSCSMAEALSRQDLLINRLLADAASNLLWQLLRHGQVDHHGVFCDLQRSCMRPLPIDPAVWARMGFKGASDLPSLED